jgi:hypothetical protein
MGVDAIITLVGLLAPPVIDFAKKLFLKPSADTPEATMSALATTNPDALGKYIEALTGYLKAQIDNFNRDVSGTPSQWISNLRASIRPIGTAFSLVFLAIIVVMTLCGYAVPTEAKDTLDGVRWTCEGVASSWFGTKISIDGK